MGFLDLLRRAREGRSSILHQYLLNAGKAPLSIHAFYEGRHDRIFYDGFLRSEFGGRAQLFSYVCGNKRSVYHAHEVIQPKLRAEDIALYFVDKDLDDLVPVQFPESEEIFVTDLYSIENYLVTRSMFERVWTELFRQEPHGAAFERMCECFSDALATFHQLSHQIAAWTIHHRRRGAAPQTNNIDMRRIFEISNDLILSAVAEGDGLIPILDDCCRVETSEEWAKERDELVALAESQPAKAISKGKMELWLLVEFLRAVRRLLEEAAAAEGRRLALSFAITESNAMEILGPRVEMPASLQEFFQQAARRMDPEG